MFYFILSLLLTKSLYDLAIYLFSDYCLVGARTALVRCCNAKSIRTKYRKLPSILSQAIQAHLKSFLKDNLLLY